MRCIWCRRNPQYSMSKYATNSARELNGGGGTNVHADCVARDIRERVVVLLPATIGPSASSLSLDSSSGSSFFKVDGAKVATKHL